MKTMIAVGVLTSILTLGGCASQPTGDTASPSSGESAPLEDSSPKKENRCPYAPVEPTYLPWLDEGEEVPPPVRTYDRQIDRAQESWDNPDREEGVALTRYTMKEGVEPGAKVGVRIQGVDGLFHVGEAGLVSIAWDLKRRTCNFVELIVEFAGMNTEETKDEAKKVAESFRNR